MTAKSWAVFSHHVPASEYDGTGFRVAPDQRVVPAVPIEVFATREEAEAWRLAKLERWKGATQP